MTRVDEFAAVAHDLSVSETSGSASVIPTFAPLPGHRCQFDITAELELTSIPPVQIREPEDFEQKEEEETKGEIQVGQKHPGDLEESGKVRVATKDKRRIEIE